MKDSHTVVVERDVKSGWLVGRVAERAGFEWQRCQGSHNTFKNLDGRIVVIPDHGSPSLFAPCCARSCAM